MPALRHLRVAGDAGAGGCRTAGGGGFGVANLAQALGEVLLVFEGFGRLDGDRLLVGNFRRKFRFLLFPNFIISN